jgi:hypothetical protein
MDEYMLNILSGWQIGVDSAAARNNLLMNAQAFPDLRFIAAASFLKIGDLYIEEGNLEEARSFYRMVAEDTSPEMAQYRALAEERLAQQGQLPNLQPTNIIFDPSTAIVGSSVFFDSGVSNTGDIDTGVFNIQWLVNNQDVGAAGSHAGVPAGQTVLDGNSQFSWMFDNPGTYSVTFTVDFDNQIEELNEGDNSTTIDVVVSPQPPPSSAKEQVQDLERRGEIPQLDRSADVEGTDANSNGIRDDVDSYIASLPITPEQKKGVEQAARALQATLLVDTDDSNALRQSDTATDRAAQCLRLKFPDINQYASIATRIEGVTFNTKERSMIYIQYNEALSGSVSKLLTGDTCDN